MRRTPASRAMHDIGSISARARAYTRIGQQRTPLTCPLCPLEDTICSQHKPALPRSAKGAARLLHEEALLQHRVGRARGLGPTVRRHAAATRCKTHRRGGGLAVAAGSVSQAVRSARVDFYSQFRQPPVGDPSLIGAHMRRPEQLYSRAQQNNFFCQSRTRRIPQRVVT